MCDYSLQNVKSRAAQVGDKLTTRDFGTGTRGFAAPEDSTTAVCLLPGTDKDRRLPHADSSRKWPHMAAVARTKCAA